MIKAAIGFMVNGQTAISVTEITQAAGVAQGSFYNHFSTKEQLFDAALDTTLLAYDDARESLVEGIGDPAELFTASFRLTGRLLGTNPVLTKLLLQAGPVILTHEHGLRPRALRDLEHARALGHFEFEDTEIAYMSTSSMFLGMAQLITTDPSRDVDVTTDQFVELALRLLRCPESRITELLSQPLPEAPTMSSFLHLE